MGRTVPEANRNDIRELIYQGYRIIYQVDDAQQIASVVAVIHGSRNISDPDNQPY
jgi:plasmid stabilization system protein ParE